MVPGAGLIKAFIEELMKRKLGLTIPDHVFPMYRGVDLLGSGSDRGTEMKKILKIMREVLRGYGEIFEERESGDVEQTEYKLKKLPGDDIYRLSKTKKKITDSSHLPNPDFTRTKAAFAIREQNKKNF